MSLQYLFGGLAVFCLLNLAWAIGYWMGHRDGPEERWTLANPLDSASMDLDEFSTVVEWHGDNATVFARGSGPTWTMKLPPMPSRPKPQKDGS